MIRWILILAIAAAACIIVADLFGPRINLGALHIELGDGPSLPVVDHPVHTPAKAYAAKTLVVRNAVAALDITPEDRADISVEIDNPGGLPQPRVALEAGDLVIDGGLDWRIHRCGGALDDLSDGGRLTIKAHVPRDVKLRTRGAISAKVGPSANADLKLGGCGAAEIGDTAGRLDIGWAGKGDVKAGASKTAEVDTAGLGDIELGAVSQAMNARIAGAGSIKAASVQGAVDASIAGSGDINVAAGSVSTLTASIAGAGSVTVDAPVQDVRANIMGSGDVRVSKPVGNVNATIMGSGDVRVAAVTGTVSKSVMGSGRVTVGE
jgi:hypothetical protein